MILVLTISLKELFTEKVIKIKTTVNAVIKIEYTEIKDRKKKSLKLNFNNLSIIKKYLFTIPQHFSLLEIK